MAGQDNTMERIVALCRRRGFIFGSSEIYGGIGGFWDYGPLGVELKRNIKDAWWHDMVHCPPVGPNGQTYQMVGVDCSIIMNPKVWEASGHVGGFQDPMVSCKEEGCKGLFRADQLFQLIFRPVVGETPAKMADLHKHLNAQEPIGRLLVEDDFFYEPKNYSAPIKRLLGAKKVAFEVTPLGGVFTVGHELPQLIVVTTEKGRRYTVTSVTGLGSEIGNYRCPRCQGELTAPRAFNLMFGTHTGALQDSSSKVYLRPETAQGIFVNFKNVLDSSRVKIPFGIAQIGKAFRNEINPRNYTFRSREFEQMEIEFFCKPDESMRWYEFWRDVRIRWYESLGIGSEKLRPREQDEDELAHYSSACTDIEYLFPFSDEPQELEGVAHRGDYDLKAHGRASKGKENAFAVIDDQTRERFVPHVIEPSAGADRFALAVLTEAYTVDENRASPEFLKIHPRLAPIKAAVFPLVAKDGLPEIAIPIYEEIRKHMPAQYDAKQSIGKRYARMDEAGTPFCFTIDGQTKQDGTLTVRSRDTAQQERISADPGTILRYLRDQLGQGA